MNETNLNQALLDDLEHWHSLKPPLSPNPLEILLFEQNLKPEGSVCLLGMTKELVSLCDQAVDLRPLTIDKPTIKEDWAALTPEQVGSVKTVIGDGVINLAGMSLVGSVSQWSDRFICRVFLKKLPGMKYATFFPNEFPGASKVIPTQDGVAIVIWDFL